MLERNSNNLDSSIKNRHIKQEEEKNFKKKIRFSIQHPSRLYFK